MKTAAGSLVVFILATLAYFAAKIHLVDGKRGNSMMGKVLSLAYFVGVLSYQMGMNISNSSESDCFKCDNAPPITSLNLYKVFQLSNCNKLF